MQTKQKKSYNRQQLVDVSAVKVGENMWRKHKENICCSVKAAQDRFILRAFVKFDLGCSLHPSAASEAVCVYVCSCRGCASCSWRIRGATCGGRAATASGTRRTGRQNSSNTSTLTPRQHRSLTTVRLPLLTSSWDISPAPISCYLSLRYRNQLWWNQ